MQLVLRYWYNQKEGKGVGINGYGWVSKLIMTKSELLYQELYSSFLQNRAEDIEWFDHGFIVNEKNSWDIYYLSHDKNAFRLMDATGVFRCFRESDFDDIPIKEYLRGMTFEDLITPSDYKIESQENSIRIMWSIDTSAPFCSDHDLEDDDEPYLNNREYGLFTGYDVIYPESDEFPYPVDIDLEVEIANDGTILNGVKLCITRTLYDRVSLMGNHRIRATYSKSKGVFNIIKTELRLL